MQTGKFTAARKYRQWYSCTELDTMLQVHRNADSVRAVQNYTQANLSLTEMQTMLQVHKNANIVTAAQKIQTGKFTAA